MRNGSRLDGLMILMDFCSVAQGTQLRLKRGLRDRGGRHASPKRDGINVSGSPLDPLVALGCTLLL